MIGTQPRGKVTRSSVTKEQMTFQQKLKWVLKYENNAVIAKLMREYKLTEAEAKVLFEDTLKFLCLASMVKGVTPPKKVDDGWHTFILFTMDYQKFCHKYFGKFLHHRPHRPEDAPDDGQGIIRMMHLVKEHLGDNISNNWEFVSGGKCRNDGHCRCGCEGR